MRRVEFIRLVSGLGAGAGLGVAGVDAALADPVREILSRAAAPAVPSRVGCTDIEQVRFAETTFRSWREQFGGGACRDALAGQVRWAAGLLHSRCDDPTSRALHSAVGSLADVAGWGDVDTGHHDTALRCFRLAVHCAEEAQDWDLRAEVLTDMARQAMDRGLLDDALSLIELAQVRADRVGGTGRAMMSSEHARIFGVSGRLPDCRHAVSIAEDHFADHRPGGGDSPFFQQISRANLTLDNGQALFYPGLRTPEIATAAREHLRTALAHPSTLGRRRCAIGTAKLSTLELLHGDRDEGITLAHQALDLGVGMRSARLTDDLHRLRRATTRHTGEPIATLQHQLDSALLSA